MWLVNSARMFVNVMETAKLPVSVSRRVACRSCLLMAEGAGPQRTHAGGQNLTRASAEDDRSDFPCDICCGMWIWTSCKVLGI